MPAGVLSALTIQLSRLPFRSLHNGIASFPECNSGTKRPSEKQVRHFKQIRHPRELTFSWYQRRPLLPVILSRQRIMNRETGGASGTRRKWIHQFRQCHVTPVGMQKNDHGEVYFSLGFSGLSISSRLRRSFGSMLELRNWT